jgi:predicted transcriptional regulator
MSMNKVIESILTRAATWPREAQEELARVAREIELAHANGVYKLSDDERLAVEEGLAQADRGEFVSDEEIEELSSCCSASS